MALGDDVKALLNALNSCQVCKVLVTVNFVCSCSNIKSRLHGFGDGGEKQKVLVCLDLDAL